jgi:hypothetical protein
MDPFAENLSFIVPHTRMVLDSFRRFVGRELIERSGNDETDARAVFDASFALLSGGSEPDQVLNYGNATALRLWERDWAEHTSTPSRLTAEPMERAAREEFLRRVRSQGFVDDYTGIRISSTGRRFLIENAIVWNLVDQVGNYAGQAATFPSWKWIAD